jgi:hypothetical protein
MRVVITHPEWGIYLGSALGLGFWSMLSSAGQVEAVTFSDESDAIDYIRSWEAGNDPEDYSFVEASPQDAATVSDLKAAGLEDLLGDMELNVLDATTPAGFA